MFCHKCGTKLEDEAKFCMKCGTKALSFDTPKPIPEKAATLKPITESVKSEQGVSTPVGVNVNTTENNTINQQSIHQTTTVSMQRSTPTHAELTTFKNFVDNHVRQTTNFQSADDLTNNSKPWLFAWITFGIFIVICILFAILLGGDTMSWISSLAITILFGYSAFYFAGAIIRSKCRRKFSKIIDRGIDTDDLCDFLNKYLSATSRDFYEWSYLHTSGGITTIIENAVSQAAQEVAICCEWGAKRKYLAAITIRNYPESKGYFVHAEKNGFMLDGRASGQAAHACLIKTAPILQAAMEYYLRYYHSNSTNQFNEQVIVSQPSVQQVAYTPPRDLSFEETTNRPNYNVPEKKSKKLPFIIGGIVVAIIIGIIIAMTNSNGGSDEVSLSETYTNVANGIAFKYPSAWKLIDEDDYGNYYYDANEGETLALLVNGADDSSQVFSIIEVLKFDVPQKDIDHLFVSDEEFSKTFDSNVTIKETSVIELNGTPARMIYYVEEGNLIYRSYLYSYNSDLYRINFIRQGNQTANLERFFDAIIDSYKIGVDSSTSNGNTQTISDYSAYDIKIDEYKQALITGGDSIDTYNISHIAQYACNDPSIIIAYSIFDIDGNGIKELLFTSYSEYGDDGIIDIYTLHNGQIEKLFKNSSFGERSHLYILDDGGLLTEGSSSAFTSSCELWRIDAEKGNLYLSEGYFYSDDIDDASYYKSEGYTQLNDNYYDKVKEMQEKSINEKLSWEKIEGSQNQDNDSVREFCEKYSGVWVDIATYRNGPLFSYIYISKTSINFGDYCGYTGKTGEIYDVNKNYNNSYTVYVHYPMFEDEMSYSPEQNVEYEFYISGDLMELENGSTVKIYENMYASFDDVVSDYDSNAYDFVYTGGEGSLLNVRIGPSKNDEIIAKLEEYSIVYVNYPTYDDLGNLWWYISFELYDETYYGFVMGEYIVLG